IQNTLNEPNVSLKLKNKDKRDIDAALNEAMEALEIGDDAEKDTFVLAQRKLKRTYLAKAEIGAILHPYLCTPVHWTALSACLELLLATRLVIRIAQGQRQGLFDRVRGQRGPPATLDHWMGCSDLGLTEEAVGLVSWNLADIVGLPNAPRVWL
ncbi:hypothetical protein BG000_010523, partial [Podila horticola]